MWLILLFFFNCLFINNFTWLLPFFFKKKKDDLKSQWCKLERSKLFGGFDIIVGVQRWEMGHVEVTWSHCLLLAGTTKLFFLPTCEWIVNYFVSAHISEAIMGSILQMYFSIMFTHYLMIWMVDVIDIMCKNFSLLLPAWQNLTLPCSMWNIKNFP